MKFNKWDIIEIFWVDSMGSHEWRHEDTIEEVAKDNYLNHKSVGYFYKQSKKGITIVESKSDDGEEKSNVKSILTIPLVAIRNIRKIK